jgi:hypothetical protein
LQNFCNPHSIAQDKHHFKQLHYICTFLQFTLNCTRQTSFRAIPLHRKRHCHFIHYNSSGSFQPLQQKTAEHQQPSPRPCSSYRSCASAGGLSIRVVLPQPLHQSRAHGASPSGRPVAALQGTRRRGRRQRHCKGLRGGGSGAGRRGPWRWEGRRR